jgi:hypothetical protein
MNACWNAVPAGFVLALSAMHGLPGALPNLSARTMIASYPAIVFVEAPVVLAGDPAHRFPQGSRLVRLSPVASQEAQAAPVPLTPQFFAAADPQVFFDGTEILFSAQQQRGAHWQIWEMAADGNNPRQITHCPGDCLQSAFLPRNQIAYTSFRGEGAERQSDVSICQENGADPHPVTFGPGDFQVETVLHSGRLLVSAESPLLAGGATHGVRTLYTLAPDGSGLTLLRQDGTAQSIRSGAEELVDGAILFLQRGTESERSAGGELAWIRPGALHASVLTQPPSIYASAQELQEGTLVAARRRYGNEFDLYTFHPDMQATGELLYRNPNASSLQAVPLVAHAPPEYYPSLLYPGAKTGRILCLDAYVSEDAHAGRPAGSIARVRVLAPEPESNRDRVLGEAPAEVDGSFYVTVPADTPIRLELMGTSGQILKAQRSWMWVRAGEDRGCHGCHESQAQAPENHWPLALRRFDTPSSLATSSRGRQAAQP